MDDKIKINNVMKFIKDYKSKYRDFPSTQVICENNNVTRHFLNKYGGYVNILNSMNYDTTNYRMHDMKSISHLKDDDFIKLFKNEWGSKAPSIWQLNQTYKTGIIKITYERIRKRFGQYENFIKICGYTEFISDNRMDSYYKIIKTRLSKYDKLPTLNKFMKDNKNVPISAIKHFGGYEKIIKDLGYDYHRIKSHEYTKQEIVEILKPIFNDCDYVNSSLISKLYNNNEISFGEGTIKIKFGSIGDLLYEMDMVGKKQNNIIFHFSNKEIIDMFIKKFIDKTDPPTQLELIDEYNNGFLIRPSMIINRFDSYSNFLYIAGYTNISNGWAVKRMAMDGHLCDSKSEMIVDNFLYNNKIWHDTQPKYSDFCKLDLDCDIGTKRADFILKDGVIVEYFGMKGFKKYDERTKNKIEILKKNRVDCLLIYPKDINSLNEIFKDYIIEGGAYNG